jgi:quinol monooxygenase YgiN
VYAVAGRWTLDPSKADQQAEGLAGIVAGVRQLPGFVRGFWSRDVADSSANLTWIVFDTREQAESFRRSVEQNVPAQQGAGVARNDLVLVEVVAEA